MMSWTFKYYDLNEQISPLPLLTVYSLFISAITLGFLISICIPKSFEKNPMRTPRDPPTWCPSFIPRFGVVKTNDKLIIE